MLRIHAGPRPCLLEKQHHISTWPVRLGWAGPESQRNEPPSPGHRRQPPPTQAHPPLPMSAGSCLGQSTLPGTLGGGGGAPGRGTSGQMDLQGHVLDPEAGPVVRAFSKLSLFLGCSYPLLPVSQSLKLCQAPRSAPPSQHGPRKKVLSSSHCTNDKSKAQVHSCPASQGPVGKMRLPHISIPMRPSEATRQCPGAHPQPRSEECFFQHYQAFFF